MDGHADGETRLNAEQLWTLIQTAPATLPRLRFQDEQWMEDLNCLITQAPEYAADYVRATGQDTDHSKAGDVCHVLDTLLEARSDIYVLDHASLVVALLDVSRSREDPVVYVRNITEVTRKALAVTAGDKYRKGPMDTLVALIEHHDLAQRNDLHDGKTSFCQMLVEEACVMGHLIREGRPSEETLERYEERTREQYRTLGMAVIKAGGSLDRDITVQAQGQAMTFPGTVALAGFMDHNLRCSQNIIHALLDVGASWEPATESNLSERARRAIDQHPSVRRERLEMVAKQEDTAPLAGTLGRKQRM